jgi:hypothetical protein
MQELNKIIPKIKNLINIIKQIRESKMKSFKEYNTEKSTLDESLTAALIGAGLGAGALAVGAHLLKKHSVSDSLAKVGGGITKVALSPVKAAMNALSPSGSHGYSGSSESSRRLGEKEGRESVLKDIENKQAKKAARVAREKEARHTDMSKYGFNPDDTIHHAHYDQFIKDLPSGKTKIEGKTYSIYVDSRTGIAKKQHIRTGKQSDYTHGMRVPTRPTP